MQVHRYEDKYFPGIENEPTIRPAPIKADFTPARRSKKKSSHAAPVHHVSAKRTHAKKVVQHNT
jgi:hypothetical protein